MKRGIATLSLGLLALPLTTQAGDVRALLDAPRAEPPAHVAYRYVIDVDALYGEGDKADTTATATIAVDATQPPGSRTTVLSRTDETKKLRKIIDGVVEGIEDKDNTPERMSESFYCTLDATGFDVKAEDAVHAVIRPDYDSMVAVMRKDGTPKGMAKRLAERLDGEIVLAKPGLGITSSVFRMTRPMKVALVAKIHDMEISQACVPSPDGFMRSERFGMHSTVSMMGKDVRTRMDMRVRDLEAVPLPVPGGTGAGG